MKYIFFILFILVLNNCNAQQKTNSFIVIKMTTVGNDDYYYEGFLQLQNVSLNTKYEEIKLINSYTFEKQIKKKDISGSSYNQLIQIKIKTPYNKYVIFVGYLESLLEHSDTISYTLNYDSLKYKESEMKELEIRKEEQRLKLLSYEEKRQIVLTDAQASKNYYSNIIQGKSHNKIADYLYDEGFSRSFSSNGSVFFENFSLEFGYENYTPVQLSYKIKISLWKSYGYGKSFYEISYSYYINYERYDEE